MLVKGSPEVFPAPHGKADDVGIENYKIHGRWIRSLIYETVSCAQEHQFINQLPGKNTAVDAETATISLPVRRFKLIFFIALSVRTKFPMTFGQIMTTG